MFLNVLAYRAEAQRLSAKGWKIPKIAAFFNWEPQTVRQTIHRWNSSRIAQIVGCSEAGSHSFIWWRTPDIAYLEECLEKEPRTYNSKQLAQKLEGERFR